MADLRKEGELLPPTLDPVDADDLLGEDEDRNVSDVELETVTLAPLGRAPAYDFVERRFIPGIGGGPLMIYLLETLMQWVEKCLRTRRGESPAVHPDFGVDVLPEDLLDGDVLDMSELAEAYTDWDRALLVHPRIAETDEWNADYEEGDDAVYVSFRVIPDGDDLDDLIVKRLALPIGEPVA